MTNLNLNQEQITANWSARGFSCVSWTDPPGARREDFKHATGEVVIILKGDIFLPILSVDEKSAALRTER